MQQYIRLDKAIKWTKKFRKSRGIDKDLRAEGIFVLPVYEMVHRLTLEEIMAQPDCVYLKFYYGIDDKDKIHFLTVGVDSKDKDMLPLRSIDSALANEIPKNGIRPDDSIDPTSPLYS